MSQPHTGYTQSWSCPPTSASTSSTAEQYSAQFPSLTQAYPATYGAHGQAQQDARAATSQNSYNEQWAKMYGSAPRAAENYTGYGGQAVGAAASGAASQSSSPASSSFKHEQQGGYGMQQQGSYAQQQQQPASYAQQQQTGTYAQQQFAYAPAALYYAQAGQAGRTQQQQQFSAASGSSGTAVSQGYGTNAYYQQQQQQQHAQHQAQPSQYPGTQAQGYVQQPQQQHNGSAYGSAARPSPGAASSATSGGTYGYGSASSASSSYGQPSDASSSYAQPSASSGGSSHAASSSTAKSSSGGSSKAQSGNAGWPPAVKAYVERVFLKCKDDAALSEKVEKELQKILNESIASADLWTRNWDRQPLPSCLVEKTYMSLSSAAKDKKKKKKVKVKSKGRARDTATVFAHSDDEDEYITLNKRGKPRKAKRKRLELEADVHSKKRRLNRFAAHDSTPHYSQFTEVVQVGGDVDWDAFTIKGTSQTLEKQYLRLTAPPAPETVRPQVVLEKSLALMRRKWKGGADYLYICEQLKSIRQDLTVQRIQNDFTITVYETHARIALQNVDMGEFCQCHTQLQQLYNARGRGNNEFTAYAVLYYMYSKDHPRLETTLGSITPSEEKDPAVQHALQVREAVSIRNYGRFFSLYQEAPNMGSYLMDAMLEELRKVALRDMCKGFKPRLELEFVRKVLCFETSAEVLQFVQAEEVKVSEDNQYIVTKIAR